MDQLRSPGRRGEAWARGAVDGTPYSEFINLPRRVVLTYKYHGLASVLWRTFTFPLRFTPMRHVVGVTTRPEFAAAQKWFRDSGHPVTLVIPSFRDAECVISLVRSLRHTTDADRVVIVVADDASGPAHLSLLEQIKGVQIVAGEQNVGFAGNVNRGLRAAHPQHDVVVLNSDIVVRRGWLASLQYAATHCRDVGIVGGKLLYPSGDIQFGGTVRNLGSPEWFDHRYRFMPARWGPANIAQPVLAVTGACMYLTREAIERIGLFDESYPMGYEDVDYCLRAWRDGLRVMYWPTAELTHEESRTRGRTVGEREQRAQTVFWRRWRGFFDARNVRTADGALRVIYVTEDTGVGGGHRVIFEHLNRLQARGHDVELWTLATEPDWFQLRTPVRTFSGHRDLIRALAPVEAIKVATWWRTAAVVWEATVVNGVPVYFVQDIETSYYSEHDATRFDVLASYRPEFRYLTVSSWIQERLHELGLESALIPPGIDSAAFHRIDGVKRRPATVVALGRSQPLKNLPLTLAAWRSLPNVRPELRLFGTEPHVVGPDAEVHYVTAPSDADINRLLNEATVFVQTSRHEGFGLPTLEAMAAGCAVVCTDAHGNRDFCSDGVNCLMPDAAPKPVAAAILRLLHDAALRERLGRAGIETASGLSWEQRIDALEHFLRAIAEPRRMSPPPQRQARHNPADSVHL